MTTTLQVYGNVTTPFQNLLGMIITRMWVTHEGEGVAFECRLGNDLIVDLDRRLSEGDKEASSFVQTFAAGARISVHTFFSDCCSETWLADVVGFDILDSSPILSINEIELPDGPLTDQKRSHQDVDQVMGWELRTSRGVCTLVVRNSSNGYYGGSVNAGSWESTVLEDWKQINGDYSA